MKIAWMILVIFHIGVVFGNAAAFVSLPFLTPWYIALPMCSFICLITFSRELRCPLTNLENSMRKKMGKKEIRGFIGHYMWRPMKSKPTWPILTYLK